MRLTFLGKSSGGGQSPTLYSTDQGSYIVQGWIVTDSSILSRLHMADEETCIEIPAVLMAHLEKDGIIGEVTNIAPPIVYVKENGNYVVQGKRVDDADTLAQMDIPDHETCVELIKARIIALVQAD
ncbi:hypothetical protein [Nonomuraea endophytica]|uniref:Uncharacterized protein n=1 Tax=Nonomuraea endophytica TaxID=714136 RepID=A0A7W8A5A8_9ACTN|nr:hypothetical protein [Nonomuraea endophytica]MBB5079837.1 hypothetical protein [Nonomuraea endophytica]